VSESAILPFKRWIRSRLEPPLSDTPVTMDKEMGETMGMEVPVIISQSRIITLIPLAGAMTDETTSQASLATRFRHLVSSQRINDDENCNDNKSSGQ
jgi:hypothetical protein